MKRPSLCNLKNDISHVQVRQDWNTYGAHNYCFIHKTARSEKESATNPKKCCELMLIRSLPNPI